MFLERVRPLSFNPVSELSKLSAHIYILNITDIEWLDTEECHFGYRIPFATNLELPKKGEVSISCLGFTPSIPEIFCVR